MAKDNERVDSLPVEFDLRPQRLGFTMRGWDFTRIELAEAIKDHRMLNPAIELGTNLCPYNCSFCFTEDPSNPAGQKRRLANEMTLEERLSLIDQAAGLGARSINFIGAGEPTTDPHFWVLLTRMAEWGVTPIVYTEGSLKLVKRDFIRRLYRLGATVVLKVNSLWNAEYQNSVVRGLGEKRNTLSDRYTERRNRAIRLLIEEGFTDCDPTRLAFDTIVCRENTDEITALHIYAREHNIFVLLVGYLPSGRSSAGPHDALTREEQFALFERIAQIDKERFSINHGTRFPYAGGVPCSIRGTGVYVKITGKAFDCPGELISLGDVRHESLAEIWRRARPISETFDGGCSPREEFWRRERLGDLAQSSGVPVSIQHFKQSGGLDGIYTTS